MRARLRAACWCGALLWSALAGPACAAAQVGDISQVSYPGWVPADRVLPGYAVTAAYNATQAIWTYGYTFSNGAGAQQALQSVRLRFNGPPLTVAQPSGWYDLTFPPSLVLPGAFFGARLPDVYSGTTAEEPGVARILAGQTLPGFSITSAYPPGYARTYAQGFAAYPPAPAGSQEEDFNLPADTTNAQRSFVLGPIRYTQVTTGGNRRPGVDGFLGFMNLNVSGSVVRTPAPIALKFSLNGETVFRETLHITLNGTDVTASFKPGPSDGADLVGVFALNVSPLQLGKNVLQTSVEGLKMGTTQRATDVDKITFTMDPNASSGPALNNIIVIGCTVFQCNP
jgi:hypothetical protein